VRSRFSVVWIGFWLNLQTLIYNWLHTRPYICGLVVYKYITEPLSHTVHQIVNRCFREFGVKQWVTIGIPKVAVAMFSFAVAAQPEDAEVSI
jgi:hypothetical protein